MRGGGRAEDHEQNKKKGFAILGLSDAITLEIKQNGEKDSESCEIKVGQVLIDSIRKAYLEW